MNFFWKTNEERGKWTTPVAFSRPHAATDPSVATRCSSSYFAEIFPLFFGGLRRCQLTDDTRIQFFFKKHKSPRWDLMAIIQKKMIFLRGKIRFLNLKKSQTLSCLWPLRGKKKKMLSQFEGEEAYLVIGLFHSDWRQEFWSNNLTNESTKECFAPSSFKPKYFHSFDTPELKLNFWVVYCNLIQIHCNLIVIQLTFLYNWILI